MLSQLEWALPRLKNSEAESVAVRVETFLRSGVDAHIECSPRQLGDIARKMCLNVTEHESNYSLTITEGDTVVILQTPITTKTTEQ
jgi:hypothetical protein